jgi:ribosomal protein L24
MRERAPVKAAAGDKVRVKAGDHASKRGVVEAIDGEKLLIRLEELDVKVRVTSEQVTNYSLAARKAWVTEPGRAVGRRKGTKLTDRVSVTLRLDRDVWDQFQGLEEEGVIDDRTGLINGWFREKLAELDRGGRHS